MTVGCIDQIAQWVVAELVDGGAIHLDTETDESPGPEQCLA
jgi:hypothetical protein